MFENRVHKSSATKGAVKMEENKYCPILSAAEDGRLVDCQGKLCAWWNSEKQDCAVKGMAK